MKGWPLFACLGSLHHSCYLPLTFSLNPSLHQALYKLENLMRNTLKLVEAEDIGEVEANGHDTKLQMYQKPS